MSGLLVERSTTLIQLQDSGRFGTRQLGVTQGGATDWISMFWANWLLGNPLGAAVIEITLGGLSLIAQQDAELAGLHFQDTGLEQVVVRGFAAAVNIDEQHEVRVFHFIEQFYS